MPVMRKIKPPRLRFTLKSLLATVTVFGVWLGLQVNRVRREREAVAAIKKLGGLVHFDEKVGFMDDVTPPPRQTLVLQRWLGKTGA